MQSERQKTVFVSGLKHRRSATVMFVGTAQFKKTPAPVRGPWTLKAVVSSR